VPTSAVRLDHIEPLNLPDGRRASVTVHAHLRQLILDGAIPPGSVLSQVELARALGVSRTPLREALRMLQEEGLIEAEPNRRSRVTGFDPADLDSVYASRVVLESLGVALTIPRLSDADVDEAASLLEAGRAKMEGGDVDGWREAHTAFHSKLVMHAGDHLLRTINSFAQRGERYLRIAQQWHVGPRWAVDDVQHQVLLDACRGRRRDVAATQMARHLARTALAVMADVAPEREPVAVRAALQMLEGLMAVDQPEGLAQYLAMASTEDGRRRRSRGATRRAAAGA
jgi:DNA-binding GntR family transcriptional regulator